MAFKINFEEQSTNTVKDLFKEFEDKSKRTFGLIRKIPTNDDVAYLAESISEARPSLAGAFILDHVTFYTEELLDGKTPATSDKRFNINFKDNSVTLDYVYISVQNNQLINRQNVKGLSGTLKTYMGRDDYTVNFTGKTIGSNKLIYDVSTVKKLTKLINSGEVLKVDSVYLNRIWDIYELVPESYSTSQSQELGQGNMLDFDITMYSDKEVNIIQGTEVKI